MSTGQQNFRLAVDKIFQAYDEQKKGTLGVTQALTLITDALDFMKRSRQVTRQEVERFISLMDSNGNGCITKEGLFQLFRKVINAPK